jgi:asparagine synthase (glutamine-hydrolysing)
MCGLLFCYNPGLEPSELRERTSRALASLKHRGPDDSGLWYGKGVAIGHRRLAILDLSASRQPMTDETGRWVLTYNGEIYNYRELRELLEARWRFRTHGDTEVLLAGLVTFGESFLERLEGMWAFAFWDNQTQTVLMSRDRMGEKPLYYQTASHAFSCASELPTLARIVAVPWEEDLNSTADYLRYGYYLPGTTTYRDVREVLPGHVLRWRPGESAQQRAYWKLGIGGFRGTPEDARATLHEKLVGSVRQRLIADVEVGAFLSGGVDSSLVVAIMNKELGVRPKTFTIGFHDPSYDERPYARRIAQSNQTEHHEEILDNWESESLTRLIFEHIGQPFADSSLLPTSLVAGLASKYVKVALSGDGGDELFSGYQRYAGRALLRWYTRLPQTLRRNAERLILKLPEPTAHHSSSLLKKAHLFYDLIKRQEAEQPYVAPTFYSKPMFARLAPELVSRGHVPPMLPEESRTDSLLEMMAADALVYLPQDILIKVDRATMAYSLEARAPFLDSGLVQFSFSLPRPWHRRGGVGKRMLRETFRDLIPRTIWRRRKQGFGVPIHQWLRGHIGTELEQLLVDVPSPLSVPSAQEMLHAHRLKARDHGYRLWAIYIYLLWRRQNLAHAS